MLIVNEVKNVAVLEERIEEYILQGITEEFNPTFNEDLVSADATNTDMNIGDESIISNGNFFPLRHETEIKIGTVLDVPISHYNFQRNFQLTSECAIIH